MDALWNFAPHDVSIIQYWLGDPDPIYVVKRGVDYIQEKIDDVVFMNIVYPNKVMTNIHVSWLDPHKVRNVTVVGSRKMVVYNDVADDKITIYDKGIDRKEITKEMVFDQPAAHKLVNRVGDIVVNTVNPQTQRSAFLWLRLCCQGRNKAR